jgi:hypothetical protein
MILDLAGPDPRRELDHRPGRAAAPGATGRPGRAAARAELVPSARAAERDRDLCDAAASLAALELPTPSLAKEGSGLRQRRQRQPPVCRSFSSEWSRSSVVGTFQAVSLDVARARECPPVPKCTRLTTHGNGFDYLSRFRRRAICRRLPPVATAGLHKGSILRCLLWLRPGAGAARISVARQGGPLCVSALRVVDFAAVRGRRGVRCLCTCHRGRVMQSQDQAPGGVAPGRRPPGRQR